ncbi:MAG: hypothetical protein EXS19_03605 [Pedosphaera sp.]|nr:hypothetical protein [Pedosphaera sp.]
MIALAVALFASAASAAVLTNADIIKMSTAKLDDAIIISAIENSEPKFDTSAQGLIDLSAAKVSQGVIATMLKRSNAPAKDEVAPARPALGNDVFPKIAPPLVEAVVGQDYFLRCTIHIERGNYVMTNYSRGEIVPINTPVKVVSAFGDKLSLKRLDNGQAFTIENIAKSTLKSLAEVGRMMLAAGKTPLEKLPADLAASIRSGEMRLGMNKEQTIMARGYPPAQETASVESDRWVYWSSRFIKQTVVFNDDRLVQGRMIH